ncbi:MAG: hypothetical protein Q9181_006621, partial [Wetmoreana brouardii]
MDPLSLTVGVSGLVGLAAEAIKATSIYIKKAKRAKEAASELLVELEALHFNLSRLDNLLKADTNHAFSSTSVLVTSTHACREKLLLLNQKLEKAADRPAHQLLWPLSSIDHQTAIQELRAFAQWIQFAITIDGSSLLSKTSNEVVDILSNQLRMLKLVEKLESTAQLTHDAVVDMRGVAEEDKILDWISKLKYQQKHLDMRLPRVDGTGEWLLEHPTFQRWRDQPSNQADTLWCHGIQGSGKSILASLVIDELRRAFTGQNVAVAHVYFDYREQQQQSIEQMTASLLKQTASAQIALPAAVAELHQRLNNQRRVPPQHDLMHALISTCKEFDKVYFVIDALDECDLKQRKGFLRLLDDLRGCSAIFVTSRPYDDIMKAAKSSPQIEIKAHSSDLRRYILQEIERHDTYDDIDESFREEIAETVTRRAHH